MQGQLAGATGWTGSESQPDCHAVLRDSRNKCGGVRGWCRGWWAQSYCRESCRLAHALPTQEAPGTAPPPLCCDKPYPTIFAIGTGTPLHLVVALCTESAEALASAFNLKRQHPPYERVFVYSKCGADLHVLEKAFRSLCGSNTSVDVVPLPNVGGCDHTYLTHIFRRLGSNDGGTSALAPVTVFTKGRPDAAALCVTQPLERAPARRQSMKKELSNFSLNAWQHTFNRDQTNQGYVKSRFDNFGAWLHGSLGSPLAEYLLDHGQKAVYGGYFSAEAWTLERYPRAMYWALLQQQVSSNEEVDHFIERLWGLLLSVPSSPALERAILAASRSVLRNSTVPPSMLADRIESGRGGCARGAPFSMFR